MRFRNSFIFIVAVLCCGAAFAQQTGSIIGSVSTDGAGLPGVTVEARSNVLPQPRVVITGGDGRYELPLLPPGDYTVTYSLSGMGTETRNVRVLLDQPSVVNVALGVGMVTETITVTADSSLVDPTSAEIRTAVTNEQFEQVPVGTNYRDLLKLAPGVQMSAEDVNRGPAGGGSEQDNVYLFDGVNISMPQYGMLNTEPSSHDIAQVSFNKGGARAVDFNRAAGFTVDSVSKSGTNEFSGELTYRIQPADLVADFTEERSGSLTQDRSWASIGIGGPVLPERLFFYGSYFQPNLEQTDRSNFFGPVPDYEKSADEFFGKLTFTPTSNILLNASYRNSDEIEENASIGEIPAETPSNAVTWDTTFKIGILEASWLFSNRAYATFKFNDYANEGSGTPSVVLGAQPSLSNASLDLQNMQQMGQFFIPEPLANPQNARETAYNAYIVSLIERYGYVIDGTRRGGGVVGADSDFDRNDFFRTSAQIGYDWTIGDNITHDLHVGYQWFEDRELLDRNSNGWGDITVPGGRVNCPAASNCAGQPVFYQATFLRAALGEFPINEVDTSYESQNIELNDTIRWNNWTFNAGLLISQDTLFGQGLREGADTLSGYVAEVGSRYEMYEIPWDKMIQPRLGATWAYNGSDTLYGSYAKYNSAVSSLPRAASWDRNAFALLYDVFFNAEGNLIGFNPRGSSTGKLFVEDLDPRYTDEFILGTAQQFTNRFALRAYGRYRYSTNFWEDTPNNARITGAAPEGIPRELYIPDLVQRLTQIGTGGSNGSYVIAELEGAYTKYYEATFESDFRATDRMNLRGSYTWSHYYGTFDQDNTALIPDNSTFVGSSNIADGPGRQVWDFKYGNLRSDRRHNLKMYGYYTLPWNATAGAYAMYLSGQHWEAWDYRPYSHLTGSTSVTNRYAEPAGSRETDPHYQLDLNYTQGFPIGGLNLSLDVDLFNVFDRQTGYHPEQDINSANFGISRLFYSPRRVQAAIRLEF